MDENRRNYIIRNFFSPDICTLFHQYSVSLAKKDSVFSLVENKWSTKFEPGIGHCIDIRHGDILAEVLLNLSLPKIVEHLKVNLEPVTSYYRVYGEHCKLPMHTDKDNYEWSATICMSYEAPECWPIYVGEDAVYLEPGDCLLYQGAKEEHGRPVFKGSWQTQLFLHYKELKDGSDGEKNKQSDAGNEASKGL